MTCTTRRPAARGERRWECSSTTVSIHAAHVSYKREQAAHLLLTSTVVMLCSYWFWGRWYETFKKAHGPLPGA